MDMTAAIAIIVAAAAVAFALSLAQARINARSGTDHVVHQFLIRAVRENRHRLFIRIPRLLNEAYIGALPLYLHAIMARFPLSILRRTEVLLNPAVNGLHTALLGGFALMLGTAAGFDPATAALAACLFAVTPQFYHALSARNFGLSARSIGLILMSVVYGAGYFVAMEVGSVGAWLVLIIASYLVIAFSTFGAQTLVLTGIALALVSGRPEIIAGTGGGLLLFIAVHPRYAHGYLTNTARFIAAYQRELAPVYVLARRHGLWRDLVWDIWRKVAVRPVAGMRYAYENSVLIVLLLNPLTVVAALAALSDGGSDFASYACSVALAGVLAFIATSFRPTRFLGEPERYVEAVTPFATLGAVAVLVPIIGAIPLTIIVGVFAALALAQVQASRILARYLGGKDLRLDDAAAAIDRTIEGEVRCAANNEQFLKFMLPNNWQFSYCIAVGHGYCGMTIGEAFDPFPFPTRTALQKIVKAYRINACVLDRTRFETVFDALPDSIAASEIAFETDAIRVVTFQWSDAAPAART